MIVSMFARALVLGLAMCAASVAPVLLRDGEFAGARVAPMDLERVVPRQFGFCYRFGQGLTKASMC